MTYIFRPGITDLRSDARVYQPFSGGAFVGAYDAIPDLEHIYEPARRTLSAYVGDLVLLRRASDNAELAFTYVEATGDLDVAAIAAWAGGASYVKTVYDQTVNADHITQAVAARQPLFSAAAQNGHAGMTFDGTDDDLYSAWTNGGTLAQPYLYYSIANVDAGSLNDGTRMLFSGATYAAMAGKAATGNPDYWYMFAGANLSHAGVDANTKIMSLLFNGASSQLWLNSVSIMSGNAGALAAPALHWGSRAGTAQFWKGKSESLIIVDPAHSDAQRGDMQDAMNAYWNTY